LLKIWMPIPYSRVSVGLSQSGHIFIGYHYWVNKMSNSSVFSSLIRFGCFALSCSSQLGWYSACSKNLRRPSTTSISFVVNLPLT
jgi:hypothetical protein